MTAIDIPLKNLRPGQDAPTPINVRKAGRDEDIETLAANMFARGQDERLSVKDSGDGVIFYASNGSRRVKALQMIYGSDSDQLIKCEINEGEDDRAAYERSLATAVMSRPLHPVDKYEAFAQLEQMGKSCEEISKQYGLKDKEVSQVLALGRLSPKIRDAWRAGEVKAEVAEAFTMVNGHKLQDKIFAKLGKGDDLCAFSVRRELGSKDHSDPGRMVSLVGIDAYQARGGSVTVDLFKDRHIVSDTVLLGIMVKELIEAECQRLVGEGWSWASNEDDMPSSWRNWPETRVRGDDIRKHATADEGARLDALQKQIDAIRDDEDSSYDDEEPLEDQMREIAVGITPRCFSDKQKKKLGCVIEIEDGALSFTYGIQRPAAASKSAPAPTAGEAPAPVKPKPPIAKASEVEDVSQALTHRLSIQATDAAQTALVQDSDLAISVLLAAIASGSPEYVRAGVRGMGADKLDLLGARSFAGNLELARALKPAERTAMLVLAAGGALDFQRHSSNADIITGNASVVCEAIAPAAFNAAMRGAFDAKDYFESVPKSYSLLAIKEAVGVDAAKKLESSPKPDIVKFAVANVPTTGWLPPQLRVKGYDGPPKAKGAAVTPAKKPPAKNKASKPAAKKKAAKKAKR